MSQSIFQQTCGQLVECQHDYDWIIERLAVGNVYVGRDLDYLKEHNFTAVVCCIPQLPHPPAEYQKRNISLLHIPIDDHPQVNISKWFDIAIDFIHTHQCLQRQVLVHCHAGMSRSVTIVTSYIIWKHAWNHIQALQMVRKQRPCILVNPGFIYQLETWAKFIQTHPKPGVLGAK